MSIYRKSVWYFRGLRDYTKSGYETAAKSFKESDVDIDCNGHSYMITGANSGIGKVVALGVAKRGGTVHMVCRNKERGESAQKQIIEESGSQNVHLHLLDMSKPKDVIKFANDFKFTEKPLDVLVNNAGCMVNTREITEDGLESNFATNTLGTHLLTSCLIPVLEKSQKAKVLTVSSGGMLVTKLDAKDLNFEKMKPFDGTFAYAQNKRQQVVMTEQYARKWTNIFFASMHPGWADTPAVRQSMPEFYEKMKNKLRTAEQGADTLLWLALSESATQNQSGLFFQDRKAVNTHLPLAWTKSSKEDDEELMRNLDNLMNKMQENEDGARL